MRNRRGVVAARAQPADLLRQLASPRRMPGPLTAEFPGQSAKLRAGHAGGVVDDRSRGVRALASQAPGFQDGDQLVGIGHPQLGQAAQVQAVAIQDQPHPFRYRQVGGRDPVRRGLDLSRQPAFRFLRSL